MSWKRQRFLSVPLGLLLAVAGPVWAQGGEAEDLRAEEEAAVAVEADGESVTGRLVQGIREPRLRRLAQEVLARNPAVAAATARAEAALLGAPRARALPDPVATLSAFLETPETRTGPQRLSVGLSQAFPGFGKRALGEQVVLQGAAALAARVESERLQRITDSRRLYYELAFLDRYREITEEFRAHLLQHEEISRARYSTGVGRGQAVVKLQAEITKVEKELLGLETRRAGLVAELNGLRDRPAATPVEVIELPEADLATLDGEELLSAALALRPELLAADARLARAETMIQLAEKGYRPDFKVGLTYTVVDSRDDLAGRLQPPEGNGDDILGIQGGITLPVWRKKLAAGVQEAGALRLAEQEAKRDTVAEIAAVIADLTQRVPLAWRQLRLVDDLLIVQAEEALESAQSGYIAGNLNALDLLDAEHVLFDARTAVARATTDYLVGLARLEGAVGKPLNNETTTESDS